MSLGTGHKPYTYSAHSQRIIRLGEQLKEHRVGNQIYLPNGSLFSALCNFIHRRTAVAETSPKRIRPAEIEDLEKTSLFEDVSKKALRKLLGDGNRVFICSLRKDQVLRLRRDNADYCYAILSGHVKINLRSKLLDDQKRLFLAWRGPGKGGILGEMRALTKTEEPSKKPRQAIITASENCEFIEIPSKLLIHIADETPSIYRNIVQLLIEKRLKERQRVEVIQMPKGEPQVAQTLLNLLDERGSEPVRCKVDGRLIKGERIYGVIDHEDIAAYYGKTRAAATNHLIALKKSRIIDYPGRGRNTIHQYTILDLDALKKRAQGK